jgi:hypothetical protein
LGDVERGKSSYHAEKRARLRSATSGISTGHTLASVRSGKRAASCAASSSSAIARSAAASVPDAAAARRLDHSSNRVRSLPAARAAAFSARSVPLRAASRRSSTSSRRANSVRHERKPSTHAATV